MNRKTSFENERKIPLFFNSEEMGRSLREVGIDVIESGPSQIVSRWYHSPYDVDLFIWSDESQNVVKFQVNFIGQVVEWNLLDGTKTGCIVEEELKAASGDSKAEIAELVRFDTETEKNAVARAVSLLGHAVALLTEERSALANFLESNTRLHHLSDAEIIKRYGHTIQDIRRPSFWGRVRKWFSGD